MRHTQESPWHQQVIRQLVALQLQHSNSNVQVGSRMGTTPAACSIPTLLVGSAPWGTENVYSDQAKLSRDSDGCRHYPLRAHANTQARARTPTSFFFNREFFRLRKELCCCGLHHRSALHYCPRPINCRCYNAVCGATQQAIQRSAQHNQASCRLDTSPDGCVQQHSIRLVGNRHERSEIGLSRTGPSLRRCEQGALQPVHRRQPATTSTPRVCAQSSSIARPLPAHRRTRWVACAYGCPQQRRDEVPSPGRRVPQPKGPSPLYCSQAGIPKYANDDP